MKIYIQCLVLILSIASCAGLCSEECVKRMNAALKVGNIPPCGECIYSDQCSKGYFCRPGRQRCMKTMISIYCPGWNPKCTCESTERGLMKPSSCNCLNDKGISIFLPNAWVKDGRDYSNDAGGEYVPERLSDGSLSSNDEFAIAITCAHNFFRTANFSGTGIPQLKWNRYLAKYALDHGKDQAKKCKIIHSTGRQRKSIPGYPRYAGENLFKMFKTPITPSLAITVTKVWYREIRDYRYFNGTWNGCKKRYNKGPIGHVTQLMWERTTDLGCDYTECWDGVIITCVYGPGGNVVGLRVFSEKAQQVLDAWSYNKKYKGLPTC